METSEMFKIKEISVEISQEILVALDVIEENNPLHLQNPLEGFCWALITLENLKCQPTLASYFVEGYSFSISKSRGRPWNSNWSGSKSKNISFLGSRYWSESTSWLWVFHKSWSRSKLKEI